MSTADKLNKLLETKQAIKQAIINKGVEVADDTKFAAYPSKIDSIEVGGENGNSVYEAHWNLKTKDNVNYFRLFYGYTGTELDVSKLDTSNVTDMAQMFFDCNSLTSLDVSNWDTNNVTNMGYMFCTCYNLQSLDVSNWDTSNVTDMGDMFSGCSNLTSLDLSNWDTSCVTSMQNMFDGCGSLYSLDLSNWYTSSVNYMARMFANCGLNELNISNFDTSNIWDDANDMFANCSNLAFLHLDYCSYETVEKIINSSNFPVDNYGVIYCNCDISNQLTPPGNWTFEPVY